MMNSGNSNINTVWAGDFTSGGWGGNNQPIWIDHTKVGTGDIITTTDVAGGSWTVTQGGLSDDELQFFELVLAALGVDIKWEDFKNMDAAKRKALLREVKINIITK